MKLGNSYHIFMFPFQWSIIGTEQDEFIFQTDLNNIICDNFGNWQRKTEETNEKDKENLYNEKNFFYEFVHPAVYDDGENESLVHHYERSEPKQNNVEYVIKIRNGKEYRLKVDTMNLNFYSTGIGVLSFYLFNDKYDKPDDILKINQYGRRVYPPYLNDINNRYEIAEYIAIENLAIGSYYENFNNYRPEMSNKPCPIIEKLIADLANNIKIKSVIDDRMYVMSWFRNIDIPNGYKYKKFENTNLYKEDFWYRYIFIDNSLTCQNEEMRKNYVKEASYCRWQNYGTVYGTSRYSFVMLTNAGESEAYLLDYFQTMYVRMAELCLIQRASTLRFSSEVTSVSNLEMTDKQLSKRIRSLYQEYIRFINQIHFREVSAQDQGIELYEKLYLSNKINERVEKLDSEIEELHNYLSLKEASIVNQEMSTLTIIATIFVPVSFVTGFFGMNALNEITSKHVYTLLGVLIVSLFFFIILKNKSKRKK